MDINEVTVTLVLYIISLAGQPACLTTRPQSPFQVFLADLGVYRFAQDLSYLSSTSASLLKQNNKIVSPSWHSHHDNVDLPKETSLLTLKDVELPKPPPPTKEHTHTKPNCIIFLTPCRIPFFPLFYTMFWDKLGSAYHCLCSVCSNDSYKNKLLKGWEKAP